MNFGGELLNNYKKLACDFCEPDFAEYYDITGLSRNDWLDNQRAQRFLNKFSYLNKPLPPEWTISKRSIFKTPFEKEDYLFPITVFKTGFIVSCKKSGCLFDKEGYEALQNSLVSLGEERIFIDKVQEKYDPFPLCLSVPTQTSWKELISGGFIASFLFGFPHGFFFLFGPTAHWGLFVANDAVYDVEILGVKESASHCFTPYYEYCVL